MREASPMGLAFSISPSIAILLLPLETSTTLIKNTPITSSISQGRVLVPFITPRRIGNLSTFSFHSNLSSCGTSSISYKAGGGGCSSSTFHSNSIRCCYTSSYLYASLTTLKSDLRIMSSTTSTLNASAPASAMTLPKRPLRYLSASTTTSSSSTKRDLPSPLAPTFLEQRNEDKEHGKGSTNKNNAFDLSSLGDELMKSDERREDAYKASNNIQRAIVAARVASDYSNNEENEIQKEKELDILVKETLDKFSPSGSSMKNSENNNIVDDKHQSTTNALREANLSQRIEDCARFKSFRYFLKKGKLIPLKEFSSTSTNTNIGVVLSDEEYLGGACIGLTNDLSRYAIGRATERDAISVEIARDVTDQILGELLQFDFRNGPLRRKYDGVKYALKKLETILYELSVTTNNDTTNGINATDNNDKDEVEPENKRAKTEKGEVKDEEMKDADKASASAEGGPPSNEMKDVQISDDTKATDKGLVQRVDFNEMNEIRKRMESRDEIREKVIKRCRDGQKAAKQAIFALHRNDIKRAKKLINDCNVVIAELLPFTEQEPFLRNGSFGCMLEEYAEAKLFFIWLQDHRVANYIEFPTLQPIEYIGGLCDVTGEIGRVAVQYGSKRNSMKVKKCLETNLLILNSLQLISLPYKLNKKFDPLKHSVEKLEQIMYELSLIQHGRSSNIPTDSIHDQQNNNNNNNKDENEQED